MRRIGYIVYVIISCLVLIAAGVWLTNLLVGMVAYPASHGQSLEEITDFDIIVSQTDQQVTRRLGEWEFSEPMLDGHFHHIGRWYERDSWNFCIECHGPIPHSRSEQTRAFLNMHTLFISCEVCHVRMEEDKPPNRFGWITLTDGRLNPNPRIEEGVWGEYGAKIIQMVGSESDSEPLVMQEERDFSAEFQRRSSGLDETQKVVANKFIHRRCTQEHVQCTHCHIGEGALLPFRELGYSQERTDFLIKPEVVDLVQRYETFLMPSLLDPEPAESDSQTIEQK
jgi:hypothetical protein